MNRPAMLHRGQRRFRNPVEYRYYLYSRPEQIDANCDRCGSRISFRAEKVPSYIYDQDSGGYTVVRGEIGGAIAGRGACPDCGRIARSITWPDAAYFKVKVPEGTVWAWNADYVPILRARVQGDKVELRHLVERNWDLARFASRLPRFAVFTKNRARVLAGLSSLLGGR